MELEDFRSQTRTWLENNCPESQRLAATYEDQVWAGKSRTFPNEDAQRWFEAMRDKGWTVPEWPEKYGGGGLTERETRILREEMATLNCRTPLFDQGIWMLGPALLKYGSEAQKEEHLPKIARGEIRWCQGYSEPGAGSDLASLQCKARQIGQEFVVTGSKMWTTFADKADWMFCLVRTDPEVKKQEGISFLLIDMNSPGVTVSHIDLISGRSHFCQTFFDEVRVPICNLVGEKNKGWGIAKALLEFERKQMAAGDETLPIDSIVVRDVARAYADCAEDRISDPSLRMALVEHEMKQHAFDLTVARVAAEAAAGQDPSRTALTLKYLGTELVKERFELFLTLMGSRALGWQDNSFSDEELLITQEWLFSKALSIAGGTSEIQLNIIAKRVLSLP